MPKKPVPAAAKHGSSSIKRFAYFAVSTDPRATTCRAWKSLMQFRDELLHNPRTDDVYWRKWFGQMESWLCGVWNDYEEPYYHPAVFRQHDCPRAAENVKEVKERLVRLFKTVRPKRDKRAGDDNRWALFPPNATLLYFYDAYVVDWSLPFPAIPDRGPLVQWIEQWIDRIVLIETRGRPWDDEESERPPALDPYEFMQALHRVARESRSTLEEYRSRGVRPTRPEQSKADLVRKILSAPDPFEGKKSTLAARVGYTHVSSLARVKNFKALWQRNEDALARARAQRAKSMARPYES